MLVYNVDSIMMIGSDDLEVSSIFSDLVKHKSKRKRKSLRKCRRPASQRKF